MGTAEWVKPARRFIGTGKREFLEQAIVNCADERIRLFLQRPEVAVFRSIETRRYVMQAVSLGIS